MWKRLLAGIFGLVGLVMWKRFLGEGSEAQGMTQDTLSGALQKTWVKSGSMSGREFEQSMADLLRAAGYKVDVLGGAGDQGVDLLVKEGRKLIAVQCK
jgi:HJR/Mrr/RecB family endonuclease